VNSVVEIGDVAEVFNGKTPSKSEKRDEGLPILKIKDVTENGKFKGTFESFVDPEFYEKHSKKKTCKGDTLILNAAHNADYVGSKQFKVCEKVDGVIATGEWLIVRPSPTLACNSYINHWLKSGEARFRIRDLVKGIHLYPKDVSRLKIPLPPLEEQKRIAAILDKADALRCKRQQAIDLTDQLLRSVFLDMFGDPVTNPKGWKIVPLEQITDIRSGITKGRKIKEQTLTEIPYMRVANVQDGHILLNDVATIAITDDEKERYKLLNNDILLTEGGDPDKLGRGAVWKAEIAPCIHQNHIFSVRIKNGAKFTPHYLSVLIGSQYGKRYFLKASKQTTGIATINKTQLKEFPVLAPPLDIQENFETFIERHLKYMDKYEVLFNQQNSLFNSLSQQAFSGDTPNKPRLHKKKQG
jgi:type I restriction enzyme, S subunit